MMLQTIYFCPAKLLGNISNKISSSYCLVQIPCNFLNLWMCSIYVIRGTICKVGRICSGKKMFLCKPMEMEVLFAVSTFPTLHMLSPIMKRTTVCLYETLANSPAIRLTPLQNTEEYRPACRSNSLTQPNRQLSP